MGYGRVVSISVSVSTKTSHLGGKTHDAYREVKQQRVLPGGRKCPSFCEAHEDKKQTKYFRKS